MQISTPTQAIANGSQAPGESAYLHEGSSPAIWSSGQKKGKPGIFARLLEGLIAKRNIVSLAPNSEAAETLEIANAGKPGKNTLKASGVKKAFILNSEEGAAGEFSSAVLRPASAFSKPGKAQAEAGIKVKNTSIDPGAGSKNTELAPERDIFNSGLNQAEDPASILVERAGERRPSGQNRASQWPSSRDGAKNTGTGDFFYASFRELDAKFSQAQVFSGQLKGIDNEKGNSRLTELKNRKNRLNIDVRDYRTEAGEAQTGGDSQKGQIAGVQKPLNMEIEIPVNLNFSDGWGEGDASLKPGKENSSGRSFEEALARELRSGLSTDMVRDATLILRNGGEGTIRLSLKPASMGDVKVRLEMTENKITGHIIVESSEALRAFERELPVLEKAFKDSGFSETNLQMSLAQDGWNSGTGGERQGGDFPSLSPVMAASRYEAETEWIEEVPIQGGLVFSASTGRTPVNLLV